MSLSATVKLNISANLSSALDLVTTNAPLAQLFSNTFTSGTGNDQVNNVFSDTRSINASSSENLDLAGVLTNALGATVTFTKVKAIAIQAASTNAGNIQVGGAGSNTFINWVADATDIVNIPAGGMFLITAPKAGFAVTATSGDILKIANSDSGAAASYNIVILGVE